MTIEDRQLVLGAIDTLANALADHQHKWSTGERAIYEEAVEALKRDAVPSGLGRCNACGWLHLPTEECHSNPSPPPDDGDGDGWKNPS